MVDEIVALLGIQLVSFALQLMPTLYWLSLTVKNLE